MTLRNVIISVLIILFTACSVKKSAISLTDNTTTLENDNSKLNKGKINKIENKFELYQEFINQNKGNEYISEIYELKIEDPQFVMLSAYSLDKAGEYDLFYRISNNGATGEWKQLPLNNEVNNPERKVFTGVNILTDIENIQFKSSNSTSSEVIFRLYVAE